MKKNNIDIDKIMIIIAYSYTPKQRDGVADHIVKKYGVRREDLVEVPTRIMRLDDGTRCFVSIIVNKGCNDDARGLLTIFKKRQTGVGVFHWNTFQYDVNEDIKQCMRDASVFSNNK